MALPCFDSNYGKTRLQFGWTGSDSPICVGTDLTLNSQAMHTCSGSRGGASTELLHPALPRLCCRIAPALVLHLWETSVSRDLLLES